MEPLQRKAAVSRFTRTLGTLVSSGVSILEGLQITAKTGGNRVIHVMILVLGVIVGGMIVAMYLPIFDMINAVQQRSTAAAARS